MAALNEIVDLTFLINDRTKAIEVYQAKLRKISDDLGRYKDKLYVAQSKVKHHTNNVKHSRSTAEIVDIKEYATTKQHLNNALEIVEDSTISIQKAKSDETDLLKRIDECQKDITNAKARLSTYGQVVPFKVDV